MAKLINLQLIETDRLVGKGVEGDPYRRITQFFSTDGTLLMEYDPRKEKIEALYNLAEHLSLTPSKK